MSKLHLCCGNVYLRGWINVDAYIDGKTNMSCQWPELVEELGTTPENYYKWCLGAARSKEVRLVDVVCDLRIAFPEKGAPYEEIMIVQGIEHFRRQDGRRLLERCFNSLVAKGMLRLDFPDVLGSAKLIEEGQDELAMRYVYCSGRDNYSVHKWGYTARMMADLLQDIGFSWVEPWNGIVHQYPVISLQAVK